MIPNHNYGKVDVSDGAPPGQPQYEAIPVNIKPPSSKLYDQLAPPTSSTIRVAPPISGSERLSNNPLYTSTGELRMSGVFNTYDIVPPSHNSHLSHRSLTLSPLPSLPPSSHGNNLYAHPTHSSTPSTGDQDTPLQTNDNFSENLYACATSNTSLSQEHLYSEL